MKGLLRKRAAETEYTGVEISNLDNIIDAVYSLKSLNSDKDLVWEYINKYGDFSHVEVDIVSTKNIYEMIKDDPEKYDVFHDDLLLIEELINKCSNAEPDHNYIRIDVI